MHDWPLTYDGSDGWRRTGSVRSISERALDVAMPGLTLGACVLVERTGLPPAPAEVVAIRGDIATCVPLERAVSIVTGSRAHCALARIGAYAGPALLGSDLDAWGRPIGPIAAQPRPARRAVTVDPRPIAAAARAPVRRRLVTGVNAIDAFVSLGYGQRVALFAGAGIGKTTLLQQIIDRAGVDARVIALVGERGREAAELIRRFATDRRRATTTIVCATAEAPPVERLAAARTATAHAEVLAASGRDVLLVVDSLTRVATAWREHALAAGEGTANRDHPPSLAGAIARLVERAGARRGGSVTGIYAVLVEGDDEREPVTDAVRALLDGHISLSRRIAESGRFPAIDVLRSLSRLMNDVSEPGHRQDAAEVRGAIAALEGAEDLFAIGAYRPGGDAALDAAARCRADIEALLFGAPSGVDRDGAVRALAHVAERLRQEARRPHLGA